MKRWFKRFLALAVFLEWLLLLVIVLEFSEAARSIIAGKLYRGYFDSQSAKVYRMVRADEVDHKEARFVPAGAAIPEISSPSPNTAPPVPLSGNDLAAARLAYAAQGDEQRQVIATLEGTLTLWFDGEGRFQRSYGEPRLEQYMLPFLRQGKFPMEWVNVYDAIRKKEENRFEIWFGAETRCFYEVRVMPHKTPEGAVKDIEVRFQDINATKTISDLCGGTPPPEESPWKISLFAYKENWSRPNNPLRINNHGFRDDDVVTPKPSGVFRIVCVGGSTTEEGNDNASSYPNIVEKKLRERFKTEAIDVVNCGICGSNSYSQRRRIQDYLALEPDLIVYYDAVNDITHVHFAYWLERAASWKKTVRHSWFLTAHFGRWLLPGEGELQAFMRDTTMRNLLAMRYAAREKNVDMAVCSFARPTLAWNDFLARNYYDVNMRDVWDGKGLINFKTYGWVLDLHNRLVKDLCAREGLYYIPVAENFKGGSDHFFDVCHMTRLGLEPKTDIIAEYLAQYLIQRGIFPAP